MARPGLLTDRQKAEIIKRVIEGNEDQRTIAKEYKVSQATVSVLVSNQLPLIKKAASAIVQAEEAVKALPVPNQSIAQVLADNMMGVSRHLSAAASKSSKAADIVADKALARAKSLDGDDIEGLKAVHALATTMNELAKPGMGFLQISKGKDAPQQSITVYTGVPRD